MDAGLALERFRTKHGEVLAEIAERGTLLDEADIKELLNLSLPGLDEVMSLFELSELDRAGTYAHIVVDTAPSGHTSRLLRLPEVFHRMVNALDRMADKHRYIVAQFARRGGRLDDVDLFLRDLNERIERVRSLLYDKEQTRFLLVAIPEAMSVRETERYLQLLLRQGAPVRDLIVNRIEADHSGCTYCHARVSSQRPWLKEMRVVFRDLEFHSVPLLPQEVRGLETLKLVGRLIWDPSSSKSSSVTRVVPRRVKKISVDSKQLKVTNSFLSDPRRIFIFGGKGGVGKTTAAAAMALALAKQDRRRRFLVFSTDPAHSLSDSFEEPVGQLKKRIAGNRNLDGMEIDPGKWFDELKQRYRKWTDELFASLSGGSGMEIKFDREAMRELVELTPPGVDEIAALGAISDLLDQDQYHSIILDTAPTGHLIRFLELPQVALSWVRTFIKLLLKYQHVVHATQVAEELVSLSKSIKRVLTLLTDQDLCEFIGVAIPERMSLEETDDLAKSLEKLKVPMRRLLVNGVMPEDAAATCGFCNSKLKVQESVINDFCLRFDRSVDLFVAPQQNGEIRGAQNLLLHFDRWKPLPCVVPAEGHERRLRTNPLALKNGRQSGLPNERKRKEGKAAR
jgi:arsenite-transporting ATPase